MLKVVRGERPERPPGASSMSDELWELVGKSWSHQPGERLKTIQLVDMMQELASVRILRFEAVVFLLTSEMTETWIPDSRISQHHSSIVI